ncbi:MAG: hypothetical protein H7296_07320 [Bacteroidia bacterium]|nr:hypothetical protein [Bacteroidia bacterium]
MKTTNYKLNVVRNCFILMSLILFSNRVFSQWTVVNELDCDYSVKVACDDGSAGTVSIPTDIANSFWGTPVRGRITTAHCPCNNPTFTITPATSTYGTGARTFTLSTYLASVNSTYGGTGSIDPNSTSPSNPWIYCCCSPCGASDPGYPCISNGCAAIIIDVANCTITFKKPTGCP